VPGEALEMSLRDEFDAAVRSATERCLDIGYHPNIFRQMIERQHPVEVGKRLVLSGELQHGIRELAKLNHLELTIESIMLQPEFGELFSSQELDAARWRLQHVRQGT
jgi:hypothetical protein